MAVWLVRAGAKGEHEQKFLDDSRIYLTKRLLNHNVAALKNRDDLITLMTNLYEGDKPRKISNLASQVWSFTHNMKFDDLVVLPSKQKPVIYLGCICSDYQYDQQTATPYHHWREIKWLAQPIERAVFSKEIRQSFSASMTICQLKKHDVENVLREYF